MIQVLLQKFNLNYSKMLINNTKYTLIGYYVTPNENIIKIYTRTICLSNK
jgi:hypothetical protein